MARHIFQGTIPPDFIPSAIGQHYIDTTSKVSYISVGTSAISDWETSDAQDVADDLTTHINDAANPHVVTKTQVGLGNVDNTSDSDKPISTATQTALNLKADSAHTHALADITQSGATNGQVPEWDGSAWVPSTPSDGIWGSITGTLSDQTDLQNALDAKQPQLNSFTNALFYQFGPNDVQGIPDWEREPTYGGLRISNQREPNGGALNAFINEFNSSIKPLQNSPDETLTLFSRQASLDPDDSGFTFGTNGRSVTLSRKYVVHNGTGSVGEIVFSDNGFDIGNGTDPISLRGVSYSYGFGTVYNNVTVNGPIQGYGFQPNFNNGVVFTSNAYVNAFYDFAQLSNVDMESGYTSYTSSPSIGSIPNNNGFTGFNLNPTIPVFHGNSGFIGVNVAGDLGTFDTGNYQGILVRTTIDDVENATGIFVDMSQVTGTNVRAMDIIGDVSINGALTFTGALSIGQLNAFSSNTVINGGGIPSTIHGLITNPTVAANVTVDLADTIGVNTAMLLNIGDNAVVTTALVGISALGLPAVVTMGVGSTVDQVAGATFALSLDSGGTGGTIANLDLCRAVAIPNGVTAVTRLAGYKMDLPFGDPGTTSWGVYISPNINNYLQGNLLVGGTAGSDDTVTNSNVALEIKSTTKALVLSRMTTTERNALTAINGMQIYNTSTDKLQGYAAGVWVDLH